MVKYPKHEKQTHLAGLPAALERAPQPEAEGGAGLSLPVILLIALISLASYFHQRQMLEREFHQTAAGMGDLILSSLSHAMMRNDPAMLQAELAQIGQTSSLERVWVIDPAWLAGCREKHKFLPGLQACKII